MMKYYIKRNERDNFRCLNNTILKILLDHGFNPNITNERGYTPLTIACQNNNETIVKYLLDYGANTNMIDDNGDCPLNIACQNNNETIVKYLLDHGANTN
eukprot:jgi/Orpsp1_1/1177956/evm.model.c7180000063514.1